MDNNLFYNFFLTLGVTVFIYKSLNINVDQIDVRIRNLLLHLDRILLLMNNINPFILNYSDDAEAESESETDSQPVLKDSHDISPPVKERFEDKYLNKYKNFSNEYKFTDEEIASEIKELERLKRDKATVKELKRIELNEKIMKINKMYDEVALKDPNHLSNDEIIRIFGLDEDEDDEFDINKLLENVTNEKKILEDELKKVEEMDIENNDEDLKGQARAFVLNQKLDGYINNYVLEHTPLGNIYMRWNNSKQSFEYFSNNTIPYRYLEPVGRKYVITYWCKPLFVDIDDELKRAEERLEEEKIKKEKLKTQDINNNNVSMVAKLKPYNKDINKFTTVSSNNIVSNTKNRDKNNFSLPPQVKANLPNVNNVSEKQLLKENSNRYTWEGRLTNFCPLKKIDKKVVDKKLSLTFADFKKMQQK
jgi:hypothetical protein